MNGRFFKSPRIDCVPSNTLLIRSCSMQNCSPSNCELLRAAKSWLSSPLPAPLHSSYSRDPPCRLLRIKKYLQCLRSWTPSFTFPTNFERLRLCFIAPRTQSELLCRLQTGYDLESHVIDDVDTHTSRRRRLALHSLLFRTFPVLKDCCFLRSQSLTIKNFLNLDNFFYMSQSVKSLCECCISQSTCC